MYELKRPLTDASEQRKCHWCRECSSFLSLSIFAPNYSKIVVGHSIIYSTQLQNTSTSYDPVIHHKLDNLVVNSLKKKTLNVI